MLIPKAAGGELFRPAVLDATDLISDAPCGANSRKKWPVAEQWVGYHLIRAGETGGLQMRRLVRIVCTLCLLFRSCPDALLREE